MASEERPGNESEDDESQPRYVLDPNQAFTLLKVVDYRKIKSKLKFDKKTMKARAWTNGGLTCIHATMRPIPNQADVTRAKAAMGNGKNDVWMGTEFRAPDSPASIFDFRTINTINENVVSRRFMIRRRHVPHVSRLKTMLLYTDGACRPHSPTDSTLRGGCSFVFDASVGAVYFAMETKGYDGQLHPHTCERAKLRAVIAALRFRHWSFEGWERVVVATDTDYVTKTATEQLCAWAARDWRRSKTKEKEVANQDLWKLLSNTLKSYAEDGCEISFWKIPKGTNTVAAAAAKLAAKEGGGSDEYEEYEMPDPGPRK
ncbi:ribonuclease H-like protein [Hypoxylon rubiginosum]|uniref:Ribonuclease H-like protein n=1 Tax=Hypoxylon rubiginosum TaxID=110542 RepID=A0ACC0CSL6_9PEZI|nr:ribonuclease H-like protein [Hypoxylon rubiginosum]